MMEESLNFSTMQEIFRYLDPEAITTLFKDC